MRRFNSLLGFGLLAGHDTTERKNVIDAGVNLLLLEEHRAHLLGNPEWGEAGTIGNTPAPCLRIMWNSGNLPALSDTADALAEAQDWINYCATQRDVPRLAELAIAAGTPLFVQGPNEVGEGALYGVFEASRANWLHAIGARAIVGNFSVGSTTPKGQLEFWESFNNRLRPGVRFVVGIHEYGYLFPWTWGGQWQGGDIAPKDKRIPPVTPPMSSELVANLFEEYPNHDAAYEANWLVGRFQWTVVPAMEAVGLSAPIWITETGLDMVGNAALPRKKDGAFYGGWRTCSPYWFSRMDYAALGVKTPDRFYALLLQWLDKYYRQFPQVEALLVFGLGTHHEENEGDGGQFKDFDVGATAALRETLDYVAASGPYSPPPDPTPDPLPDPPPPPEDTIPVRASDLRRLQAAAEEILAAIEGIEAGVK